jgi:hypothetical protein
VRELGAKCRQEANVSIHAVALSDRTLGAPLHLFNYPFWNSLRDPTRLGDLLPGLKLVREYPVEVVDVREFLLGIGIENEDVNWLVLDAPGEEWTLITALIDSGMMASFQRVMLNCSHEPLYKGAASDQELLAKLSDAGFLVVSGPVVDDPDWLRWDLVRDAASRLDKDLLSSLERVESALAVHTNAITKALRAEAQRVLDHASSQLALNTYLAFGKNVPRLGGWSIGAEAALELVKLVEENDYELVLEFGSGVSTAILAIASVNKLRSAEAGLSASVDVLPRQSLGEEASGSQRPTIVSFEHSEEYYDQTDAMLERLKLRHRVSLIFSPLCQISVNGEDRCLYYDCEDTLRRHASALESNKSRVLVLVDGPPGNVSHRARFPAVPLLLKHLGGCDFDILLDDYGRAEEREIASSWVALLEQSSRTVKSAVVSGFKQSLLINVR